MLEEEMVKWIEDKHPEFGIDYEVVFKNINLEEDFLEGVEPNSTEEEECEACQ